MPKAAESLPAFPFPKLSATAHSYARHALAPATRRAYAQGWRAFEAWCGELGAVAYPASGDTIANYAAALASSGRSIRTINKAIAAITYVHRMGNQPLDRAMLSLVMRGVSLTHGVAPKRKRPLESVLLSKILTNAPPTLKATRDRALLLIGFAFALRRSELINLDYMRLDGGTGIIWTDEKGCYLELKRSKTDQTGVGICKAITRGMNPCPCAALEAWLAAAEIREGPAFRGVGRGDSIKTTRLSDRSVARIIKNAVRKAAIAEGLTLEEAVAMTRGFSGHSLRAGYVTSAIRSGLHTASITRHSGWKDSRMLSTYHRPEDLASVSGLEHILKSD